MRFQGIRACRNHDGFPGYAGRQHIGDSVKNGRFPKGGVKRFGGGVIRGHKIRDGKIVVEILIFTNASSMPVDASTDGNTFYPNTFIVKETQHKFKRFAPKKPKSRDYLDTAPFPPDSKEGIIFYCSLFCIMV